MAPIPAARTKIPRPVKSTTTSPHLDEGRVESVVVVVVNDERKLSRSSSSPTTWSSDDDDLTLDSQSLDMFCSRNELNQTTNSQRAAVVVAVVDKRQEQQLELQQSIERTAEAKRLKLAQERQQHRQKVELEMRIETKEQRSASPPEVEERTKRKKWDRHPQKKLEILSSSPTARSQQSSDDDEVTLSSVPVPLMQRLRVPSVVASRTSSVSEFFSLSEDEDEMPIAAEAVPKEFHCDDGVKKEEEDLDDPDASFVAMCAALARRKQRGEPQLPNDVVPIETLESADQVDGDSSSPVGDASGGFWRRSSSEPGWITEKNQAISSTSPRSTSPALRRSSSFNDVPGDSLLFPLLSNSSFSAVL